MKHIKLFESFNYGFNSGREDEVIDDIKTIAYILEDDGYRIEYLTKDEGYHRSSITGDGIVPKYDIQLLIKLPLDVYERVIREYTSSNPIINKFHKDVEHFYIMLKEHLDYISDIKLDLTLAVCKITIKF